MKQAVVALGPCVLALALVGDPVGARADGAPAVGPAWAAWGGPGVGPTVSFSPSWVARWLGHGPVGCYFTRVRADNRWLRAQICDWY
jgi:hypothetical protein